MKAYDRFFFFQSFLKFAILGQTIYNPAWSGIRSRATMSDFESSVLTISPVQDGKQTVFNSFWSHYGPQF